MNSNDQGVVDLNNALLDAVSVNLPSDAWILDLGCGTGRHTYEYLDAGYPNVFGYDKYASPRLRSPHDARHFRGSRDGDEDRFPFDDGVFDLVFSTSVLEHVLDKEAVLEEVHRILKPGAVTLHVFPSRWRPVEPHVLVPLAGAIQWRPWFWIWACMGIRNPHQRELTVAQVVDSNAHYAATGIRYMSNARFDRLLTEIFDRTASIELAFLQCSTGLSSRIFNRVGWLPCVVSLFRALHTRVVVAWKAGN